MSLFVQYLSYIEVPMQQEPLDPSLVVSELMDPGPIDLSVLTQQEYHQSNVIGNIVVVYNLFVIQCTQCISLLDSAFIILLFLQDNPLLRCRRREAVIARAPRLHSRIVSYIKRARLYGLYILGFIQLDWALITALVERWQTKTHTFHLPYGEMTITLEDVEV